jgi:hypothetical protein
MLLSEIERIVTLKPSSKPKPGFQEIEFDKMLSKPKKKKEFKELNFKQFLKQAPVSEQ